MKKQFLILALFTFSYSASIFAQTTRVGRDDLNVNSEQQVTDTIDAFLEQSTLKSNIEGSGYAWDINGSSIYYNGGKVGIGTSSPLKKLHVIGNIKASESINAAKYYVDGQKAFDANSGFLYIGYGDFPSGIYINKKIRTTENVEPYSNLASDLGNTNSRWNDIYGNYLDLNDRIRLRGVLELKGISEATTPSKFWSIYHNADSDNDYGLIFSYNGTKELSLRDHKVGIGTASPDYKLDVVGTIRAHEIKVNTNKTADHVFASDYPLRSLSETEAFIQANHHLPEIASATEMVENGVNMAEFQIQLLQKIEEMTLHMIEMKKTIERQNTRIRTLESVK